MTTCVSGPLRAALVAITLVISGVLAGPPAAAAGGIGSQPGVLGAHAVADPELRATAPGSIAGRVADGPDPIAGAKVEGSGPEDWSTVTDASGNFASGPLPPGSYEVVITADGYVPFHHAVDVRSGEQSSFAAFMAPIEVGVLGDWEGTIADRLSRNRLFTVGIEWSADLDLDGYAVIVVNGGDPDQATFDAVMAEAAAEKVSIVYLGTQGVDQGGVRLLERFTDRVAVGAEGDGAGNVQVRNLREDHPVIDVLEPREQLMIKGSPYSVLDSYVGTPLADLSIGAGGGGGGRVAGLGIAYDRLSRKRVEVVLASSAVTATTGPGRGWSRTHFALLRSAVRWAQHQRPGDLGLR